jgi:hypothetical protein
MPWFPDIDRECGLPGAGGSMDDEHTGPSPRCFDDTFAGAASSDQHLSPASQPVQGKDEPRLYRFLQGVGLDFRP